MKTEKKINSWNTLHAIVALSVTGTRALLAAAGCQKENQIERKHRYKILVAAATATSVAVAAATAAFIINISWRRIRRASPFDAARKTKSRTGDHSLKRDNATCTRCHTETTKILFQFSRLRDRTWKRCEKASSVRFIENHYHLLLLLGVFARGIRRERTSRMISFDLHPNNVPPSYREHYKASFEIASLFNNTRRPDAW